MSTPRAHEHWWDRFLPRRNQSPSNWQCSSEQVRRRQNTDEVPLPRTQNTDGIRYPLHQREQAGRPFLAWRDEQIVLQPRYVAPTETGPKSRRLSDGHIQYIHPRNVQESEPIARVTGPQTPIPDTSEARAFDPIDLPAFLRAAVPGMAPESLPAQRLTSETPLVRKLDPTSNILETMRPRRRYEMEKTPLDELPTVPDANGLVRAYMAALPPWHPLPPPVAPPSGWLNDNQPEIELWSEPDIQSDPEPTTEDNIPTRKLEPVQLPTYGKSATLARVDPGLWQLQQWAKHKKESE